ncbi:MAG: AIPR family protein [Candidatus Pacebacteria bacterium]|nr:AIPR family protein [Candidatus Paceibacterota bacterium]
MNTENKTKIISIKLKNVSNFRKVYDSEEKGVMYGATCPIMSIHDAEKEIDQVLGINPRNQKHTSAPSKAMQETLRDEQDAFVFRNRGLTFIVRNANWDNKTGMLEMLCEIDETSDSQTNGLADGAHTYEVIKKFIDDTDEAEIKEITADVRLDIISGLVDKDEILAMVDSRNKSTPVRTESKLNYEGVFDSIKEALSGQSYENMVAYYENQLVDEKNEESGYRPISINSVLSFLMCFDLKNFNENKHPVVAYSSKKKVLEWFEKRFSEDENDLKNLSMILPQILDLKDYIESQIPKVWGKISARFADQQGVKKLKKEKQLDFSKYKVNYLIPGGFVYPLLSAFRAFLENTENGYKFKVNPKEVFDQMNSQDGRSIIYKLVNVDDKNPNSMGKNAGLYDSCYGSLRGYYYESLVN